MQANQDIRNHIYESRLRNWQVAQQIGISDSRFSVWLRTPLSNERKERVEQAIDKLVHSKIKN